jgi:hypothetical protein
MNSGSGALLRAIRGPLVLITLGILFALQQAGHAGFWQTWPILLIVIGVLKLLEHASGRGQSPTPGGMS